MKTVYLLPNLITTANLVFGFLSILEAIRGHYSIAAWYLVLSGFFDSIDGRVARMARATSNFGVQYDSLSDLTSFGIAPAVLMSCYALNGGSRIEIGICAWYLVCAALRLARFNVTQEEKPIEVSRAPKKGYFQGLPSPMAAGLLISFVLVQEKTQWLSVDQLRSVCAVLTALFGAFMVSTIPFPSFKEMNWRSKGGAWLLLLFAVFLFWVTQEPQWTLFSAGYLYLVLSLFQFLRGLGRSKKNQMISIGLVCVGLLLGANSFEAHAKVLINPPNPYRQLALTDDLTSRTLYFAASSTGSVSSGFFLSGKNYRMINTSNPTVQDNWIWVDVKSDKNFATSGKRLVVTLSASSAADSAISLRGAQSTGSTSGAPAVCVDQSNCQASNRSASYANQDTLRIAFSLDQLCAATTASSTSFCSSYPSLSGAAISIPLYVTFSLVDNASTQGTVATSSTNDVDVGSFTLHLSDIAPTLSFSGGITDFYFPGDEEILFYKSDLYSVSTNAGAPIDYFLFMANRLGNPVTLPNGLEQNTIISYVPYLSAMTRIGGFQNTTNGTDNTYRTLVHALNEAGIASNTDSSTTFSVQSQKIRGVLNEGKCFIATSAFHDQNVGPVRMLRKFRDQVLLKSPLGASWVRRYYRISPALAEWAWDKPWVRYAFRKILLPVQVMAWLGIQWSHAEEKDPEAYIKELRKKENLGGPYEPSNQPSYTEQLKKELGDNEPKGNYIEELRAKDQNTPKGSFLEEKREEAQIKKQRISPIEAVTQNIEEDLSPERPPMTHAFSFQLGYQPGVDVFDPQLGNTMDSIYGTNWRPDFWLHYEYQLFHSEWLGSLGLGGDFGISYAAGKGKLSFPFNGSTESRTSMQLLQLPLMGQVNYRFNALRLLRPYAGVSAGPLFYLENREDEVKDPKGYTFAYATRVGVGLLLDYFDSKTARDAFMTSGTQKTSLFVEYLYLNTFSGVSFRRNGIYIGVLFEQ